VSIKTRSGFRNIFRNIPISLAVALAIFSCNKEPIRERPVDPPDPPPDSITFKSGCFVVNEGNYLSGNASVTFIDNATGTVVTDAFGSANQRSLGDVAQSMKVFNGRGYIVVNNSNKVEVVSLDDFTSLKTIEGFHSPRNLEIVDSTKAYVTNLHGDISVVDLNSLEITGSIPTQDWTESMVKYQQYVFITSIGKFSATTADRKAKVFIINIKEDKIVDSILTGKEPMNIVVDKKDKLWVLCTGGWDGAEPPALLRINPDLLEVEKVFVFSGTEGVPSRLCINSGRDTLYFLNAGIFRMPVASSTLPEQAFILNESKLFYGLDVDPFTGTLWASDAIDYVQNGKVYQYNASTGALLKSFKAGRIPGSFAFTSQD
jgi:DNA-binding beta-propeller fold protein YncE